MRTTFLLILLSSWAWGQESSGVAFSAKVAAPEVCIHGPWHYQSAGENAWWIDLADTGAWLCWPMRGNHIKLADFGGGLFAINEFGEVVILSTYRARNRFIEEFAYGVR
jgi:hypothetical protein